MTGPHSGQTGVGVQADPHHGQPVLSGGASIENTVGALVLLHGRGAGAANILPLGAELGRSDLACRAPHAFNATWYPYGFMAPIEQNEPWYGSALATLDRLFDQLEADGIPASKTALVGFSQGACLATTYAALRPKRYGGVVAFTGGLIGPPGTRWPKEGSLEGTPVFLGASDRDPHIPRGRVAETAIHLEALGASVTEKIYPGMGHTINADELHHARNLIASI